MTTKKETKKRNVVIATGGSGGHIFPARAFAHFIKSQGYNPIILTDMNYLKYINKNDPIKYYIVQSGKNLKNPKAIINIIFGVSQALWHLLFLKPVAVVGFGGYASIPTLISSIVLRKKMILHEQNSYLGRVNNIFLKFAKVIATSYREFYGIKFKYMNKIKFVGVPVREEIKKLAKSKYKFPNFNKNEKFNILILGGSGGSKFFSEELVNAITDISDEKAKKLNIMQQCRSENVKEVKEKYKNANIQNEVHGFFSDINKKIEDAHLIIARAGASSLAEFAIAGKPVILIPFPFAINDHQMKNAKAFESRGGVVIVNQKEFKQKEFTKSLISFIDKPEKLEKIADNLRKYSVLDAEKELFKVLEEIINAQNKN
jgi:UDP-N-acetylglucosamine--N-acetylmuramyl-(pentapeptide) pyrophosphoryl-undecaprenol N-acetylglucosamine transferase